MMEDDRKASRVSQSKIAKLLTKTPKQNPPPKDQGSFGTSLPTRLTDEIPNGIDKGHAPSVDFPVFHPTETPSEMQKQEVSTVESTTVYLNPETSGSSVVNRKLSNRAAPRNLRAERAAQEQAPIEDTNNTTDYDPCAYMVQGTGAPRIGCLPMVARLAPIEITTQYDNKEAEVDKKKISSTVVDEVEPVDENSEEPNVLNTRLENVDHRPQQDGEKEPQEGAASDSEDIPTAEEYDKLMKKYEKLKDQYQQIRNANTTLKLTNQDLKDEKQELIKAQQTLVEARQTLTIENSASKDQYERLEAIYFHDKCGYAGSQAALKATSFELEKWQMRNDQLTQSKDAVERTNANLEKTLKAYDDQLIALRAENESLIVEKTEASAELAKYLLESSPLAGDNYFQNEWTKLDGKIRDWSQHNFRGKMLSRSSEAAAPTKPKGPRDEHHFRYISKDHQRYITSDDKRPLLVQSFVWSVLVDKVFTNLGRGGRSDLCGIYWSESQRDSVSSLGDFLYPSGIATLASIHRSNRPISPISEPGSEEDEEKNDALIRRYMKWKAATSLLVLEQINEDPDTEIAVYEELIDQLVNYILGHLHPLCCLQIDESCRENLRNILCTAIKLDGMIHQQWAILVPKYRKGGTYDRNLHGFPFDPEFMEEVENSRGRKGDATVQMVVAPALIRYGTRDGEQYAKHEVLVRAQVYLQASTIFSRGNKTKEPIGDPMDEVSKPRDSGQGGLRERALGKIGIRLH